ncbi:MAG TPA: divalent-cation tolerance protein CutA [Bryobacteraceae bacterium]|nr:divalent-cation tolerance protein CutA [Bryobacteraceae bacterium]
MTETLLILCACANDDDALRIANTLVEQRLAACVNIVPGVRSIYRWREQVESGQEILLFIKTSQERFPALRDRIAELHPYDTPEVIALPIVGGLEKYLVWLREQV